MVHDYVLPTPDGPMPTVAWEGAREGILDYRIIRALEQKVITSAGSSDKAKKVATAALWLARLRHSVDPELYQDCKPTDYHWDRPDVFEPDIDLDKMRAEAIEFLAE